MLNKYIDLVNKLILSFSILFACLAVTFIIQRINYHPPIKKDRAIQSLPENFLESSLSGTNLAKPFSLHFEPVKMQLPDLRKTLYYKGRNERPDIDLDQSLMCFGIQKNEEEYSCHKNEKVYLLYNKTENHSSQPYSFSPNNETTSLWFTAEAQDDVANIHLFMLNEEGHILQEPDDHARFSIKEQRRASSQRKDPWLIEGIRVDPTLLVRQKAKWYGKDLFLEEHAGHELAHLQENTSIYFLDKDNPYITFIGKETVLVFEKGRWHHKTAGEETINKPLISLLEPEENVLRLKIYDESGKRKYPINLIKTRENWSPKNYSKIFKCVGARTQTQFTFEIDGKRQVLSEGDWLLETEHGFVLLNCEEDIDAYVLKEIEGTLFILDGSEIKEGEPILKAILYSPKRTQRAILDISLPQGTLSLEAIDNIADTETEDSEEEWDEED